MGILLIVSATFSLMSSNTIVTAAFAQTDNNVVGCAHTVLVTISHLANQSVDVPIQVVLSNVDPFSDAGTASISIPGIGNGQIVVEFHASSYRTYEALVSDMPGQNGVSHVVISDDSVCNHSVDNLTIVPLYIPGVGGGTIEITKVN
jgi:hypothetical protein